MNEISLITNFLKSEQLLSFHGNISTDSVVVSDINEVFLFSEDWTDLREEEASLLLKFRGFDDRFEFVSKLVFAYLPYKFHDFWDDVVTDLEICTIGLSHPETKSVLSEAMWNIYLEGGFPCGWQGKYPQGKLRVFWDVEGRTPEPENNAHLRRILYQQKKLREEL